MPEDKPFCFVISPISDRGTEMRRRANGVFREIIEPALPDFHVERADHDKTPGIVTEGIINNVIDADLVVADLTDRNPNVMYELAVRHALGKPFVQMMEEGGELPFDIGPVNTVFFRADLDGRAQAVDSLREAAERAMEEGDLGNPIRRTVQFRGLAPEEGSEDELLIEMVHDLRSQLNELRHSVTQASRFLPPEQLSLEDVMGERFRVGLETISLDSPVRFRCGPCGKMFEHAEVGILKKETKDGVEEDYAVCSDCLSKADDAFDLWMSMSSKQP